MGEAAVGRLALQSDSGDPVGVAAKSSATKSADRRPVRVFFPAPRSAVQFLVTRSAKTFEICQLNRVRLA